MSKADDFVTKSKGRQLLTAALDYDHDKHLGMVDTDMKNTCIQITDKSLDFIN